MDIVYLITEEESVRLKVMSIETTILKLHWTLIFNLLNQDIDLSDFFSDSGPLLFFKTTVRCLYTILCPFCQIAFMAYKVNNFQ